MTPTLSVVIASHNASRTIVGCLHALEAQPGREGMEVLVADSSTDGTDAIIRAQFPNVRLLHFTEPLTVPQLRGQAMAVACGEIIAVIDPYSIVDERWLPALLEAHKTRPNLVIGGAVELHDADRQDLAAWTLYISEYGPFMLPLKDGPIDILPGSNISYKRPALGDTGRLKRDGFWKTFVNWDLLAREGLWLAPSVIVRLRKPIPFRDFLRTRYDHGRCFAGMRTAAAPLHQRLLRACTAPLLPAVLWFRTSSAYWPKRRYRRQFILTIPAQLALLVNWARGELWGYLRGCGGSCSRLFY